MYDRLNEEEKQQYTKIMEELKDQQYMIRKLSKRKEPGRIELLKQVFKRNAKFDGTDPIPPRKPMESNYFSEHRIAVYTCIIGAYDSIKEPVFRPDNCDFYMITDQEIPKNSVWKKIDVQQMDEVREIENPTLLNRYFKMNPYEVFSDYRYSLYVDGNFRIITDPTEYVNHISRYGIGFLDHGVRKCLYDEIRSCIELNKAPKEQLLKLEEYFRSAGMPEKYGLLYGGIIARDHSNEMGKEISKAWWEAFKENPMRDQILLPYVLFKKNIPVSALTTLGWSLKSAHGMERCRHS